jgi:hypothetical protein
MVRLAKAHGWTVQVTYAKGHFPNGATGRPGPAKESLAVRMARPPEHAVAVYVGGSTWSWETLMVTTKSDIWRYPNLGMFMDMTFGLFQSVAPWPWVGKPMVGTYKWHPPWIWPGRS